MPALAQEETRNVRKFERKDYISKKPLRFSKTQKISSTIFGKKRYYECNTKETKEYRSLMKGFHLIKKNQIPFLMISKKFSHEQAVAFLKVGQW